jgi:hypothetical protein
LFAVLELSCISFFDESLITDARIRGGAGRHFSGWQARQGLTAHERFVLGFGLAGAISANALVFIYFASVHAGLNVGYHSNSPQKWGDAFSGSCQSPEAGLKNLSSSEPLHIMHARKSGKSVFGMARE